MASPAPAKRTLLIVDDEEGPRQSLRIVFKDDYHILLADSGERALELARQQPVDAAVVDIRMSGMSGTELLGQLKQLDPAIEVIMLTAYETIDTARQALRLGACDYLTKPFDLPTIRAAVSKAMERHALTEDLRANNEKLKELQRDIEQFQAQKEQFQTKQEIYASIVHDINGPLTVISGFIEILVRKLSNATELAGPDLEFVKDRLAKITRQVTNCIEISQRYLSLLRRQQTDPGVAGINTVLADLGEQLRMHPSAKHNELIIEPLRRELRARVNATDLHQILQNLVINGLQCSPRPHRVRLRAESLDQPLDLARCQNGPQDCYVNLDQFDNRAPLLAVSVEDDGPGIAPEVLPKIFEPYFTTKSPGQGTGLGLPIVVRLVREARGALHLHTEVGRGSTFTVYLPT
jgi:signal transduction histidine kinase